MDSEQVTQAEKLVELFDQRDVLNKIATIAIFDYLRDPILGYLATFFQCDVDSISWETVDLDIPVMIISCTINYDTVDQMPKFMNVLAPHKANT